ncbi:hypothetical protein NKH61_29445 [Mesorhizobium sp. M1005]|uniref:hypothetical protein n=1 Tax=unclassified Mesorhizobium TaxID=325217 RepID=UPI003334D6A1
MAAALVITGCQNSGYLLKTYSASVARKHVVQTAGGSFWVFDRPDLGKIMTFAAVRTVMRSVDEIVRDDPVQLFELSEKIEGVSLQILIESMSKEMLSRHKEGFWQAYFFENPFVLKVLFGLPVVMYTSQASVGRMGLGAPERSMPTTSSRPACQATSPSSRSRRPRRRC